MTPGVSMSITLFEWRPVLPMKNQSNHHFQVHQIIIMLSLLACAIILFSLLKHVTFLVKFLLVRSCGRSRGLEIAKPRIQGLLESPSKTLFRYQSKIHFYNDCNLNKILKRQFNCGSITVVAYLFINDHHFIIIDTKFTAQFHLSCKKTEYNNNNQ